MKEKLLKEILLKRNFILEVEDPRFITRYTKKIGVLIINIIIVCNTEFFIYIDKFNCKKFLIYKNKSCNKFINNVENILDKFEALLETIKNSK